MSGLERIQDFLRWLGEVESRLSKPRLPATALGVVDDAPVVYRKSGDGYIIDRNVSASDTGPIYLNEFQALSSVIHVNSEAAIYGASAARIEAAKTCPFPLEDGTSALSPLPDAWAASSAAWRLVAAPKARIEAMRNVLINAGARPQPAFAIAGGEALHFNKPARSKALIAAMLITVVAGAAATASVIYNAGQIEAAAAERLSSARQALTRAETEAAAAASAREAAASPMRQAQIVGATLDRAPSVAARLADLVAATPDNAYLKRLTISPNLVSGEFVAPDAAALATAIGASPGFQTARLKGPARTDAAGQQRATLDITPDAAP